ncbi:hypothetical protein EC9_15910 [Rosistilla ulvae]|uniref:Uncharacterized protein n=1 Tax=Rosistilla ulvae TaxID=1930277 RepID=A0A517LXR8_9BACT|nr:hypothetical protein [Rosistilla ulvae]QDS87413.1 hypothetical protein EC9_15910 [Rosistilla ulvae]
MENAIPTNQDIETSSTDTSAEANTTDQVSATATEVVSSDTASDSSSDNVSSNEVAASSEMEVSSDDDSNVAVVTMNESDASDEDVTEAASDAAEDDQAGEPDVIAISSFEELDSASEPFVGRWQNLISTTNWEKGRIIHEWREALIESDAPATEYSDEAWAKRVGGVTSPHVGRLRRVHETFGSSYETYPGLYWSHFLAALDWDDAPMWLEGAMRSGWSVSGMREQRWQSMGAVDQDRPQAADIVTADPDEDVVLPAQGGSNTKFDDESGDIAAGPAPEGPDFGDEDEQDLGGKPLPTADFEKGEDVEAAPVAQPFAGLPELPPDMSEALEMFKLAILRHKAAQWGDVSQETVLKVISGLQALATNEV